MNSLNTHFDDRELTYDGANLAPHWIYHTFGIVGDALVAFVGEANVPLTHMVDLEDVKRKAPIYSPKMLHFVGEFFDDSFRQGILTQHLLVRTIYETLWENGANALSRKGDDIYCDGRKLSVSIATRSPLSNLIHVGVNVKTEGTPVPTSGLEELSIEASPFAKAILEKSHSDKNAMDIARVKVLPRL